MSIIPFDNGNSYVVTSIPVNQQQYRFTDGLGRTEEDRRFLEQFERIFYASASGDLDKCRKIVSEGFCDFTAFSVGKFGTPSGKSLDKISPLRVVELNKHQNIVEYFTSQMQLRTNSASMAERKISEKVSANTAKKRCDEVNQALNELQPKNSQSPYYAQLSHEEKKIYDDKMDSLSNAHKSSLTLYYYAAGAIECSYNDDELKENPQAVQAIEDSYRCNVQIIEFLKKRIEQPFNCRHAAEKRIQMMALVECLGTFNNS